MGRPNNFAGAKHRDGERSLPVLTPKHKMDFDSDGYVVIKGLIPATRCNELLAEVWSLLSIRGVEENDPKTWGAWPEGQIGSGFLNLFPIYHLKTGWENRQDPQVYECFVDLLGETDLAVSIDRVNFKRPTRFADEIKKAWLGSGFVHHDVNLWHPPLGLQVQGLIALTSSSGKEDGGFWCIPGFHHEATEWALINSDRAVPADQRLVDFLSPEECGERLQPVSLSPGDLLVWNSLLPHGNSPNLSDKLRACQYVRMFHSRELDSKALSDRLRSYETGQPPCQFSTGTRVNRTPNDEPSTPYEPPPLSQLGRRLLGIEPW